MNGAGQSLRPGDLVAGKYRVERVLGMGGMGVVVAARHAELGRKVALKFMRPDALDKGGVERFVREARVAASIESDHVAQVIDVGRTERGDPYLVMELLEGRDLSAVVASGPQRPESAVGWVLEACEGLASAHACGLVHRDVKPANLFLAQRAGGRAVLKVLDFGLAKTFTGEDASLTTTGGVLGSPQYMAPEQLLARPLDARVDVWALGVCLFELLAGALPFEAPTVPALCSSILKEEPRDSGVDAPRPGPGSGGGGARVPEQGAAGSLPGRGGARGGARALRAGLPRGCRSRRCRAGGAAATRPRGRLPRPVGGRTHADRRLLRLGGGAASHAHRVARGGRRRRHRARGRRVGGAPRVVATRRGGG